MRRRFFALFAGDGLLGRVSLFRARDQAEHAQKDLPNSGSEIVRFSAEENVLMESDPRPVFLAFTMEDEGIRICGTFRSEQALNTYRAEHFMESPLHTVKVSSNIDILLLPPQVDISRALCA